MQNWIIPGWRDFHRMWSVRLLFAQAIVNGFWSALPILQGYIPPVPFIVLNVGCSLFVVGCRLLTQKGITSDA